MKKLALLILLGCSSPIALYAHCGVCGVGGKHQSAEIKAPSVDVELKNMAEALSLDAAQQAKIKPILEKYWNEKSKTSSGKDKKAQKATDTYQKEIRKVLNKDQQAKMDEMSKGKHACCPSPWTKCEACGAMGSDKH